MVVPEELGCDAFLAVVVVPGCGLRLRMYGGGADTQQSIGVVVPRVMVVPRCWSG